MTSHTVVLNLLRRDVFI